MNYPSGEAWFGVLNPAQQDALLRFYSWAERLQVDPFIENGWQFVKDAEARCERVFSQKKQ